jgi:hypothetical protein
MKKLFLISAVFFSVHSIAQQQNRMSFAPVTKRIFDITKTYHSHYRAVYEVRIDPLTCQFTDFDTVNIYWRNTKKGDQAEGMSKKEMNKYAVEYDRKTNHQITFQVKAMKEKDVTYPMTVDLMRIGTECEPMVSGPELMKVETVHLSDFHWVVIPQKITIRGIGFDHNQHEVVRNM